MTQALEQIAPLIRVMANERTQSKPDLFDDAVQEGMIAAWRAEQGRPGMSGTYYRGAARNGVLNVAMGRPFTGQATRRGWQDAHNSSSPTGDTYPVEPMSTSAADAMAAIEAGDDVRQAVAKLEPELREVAYLHFWEDLTYAQIGKRLGKKAGTISWLWSRKIAPALRESLA